MNRVVVTGLGALTPIGNSVSEFWDGLVAGRCGIDFITRFDTADFRCKLAAEVKNFDPLLRIDKPTVRKTDLYTQYALYAAAEAMEDSALEGKVAPEDFGVYFGSGVGGINTLCAEQDLIREAGPKKVSPQFIPKMIINIAAGQIAIRYGAHGNAMCVSTACATGTSAVGEAYRAIRHGYAKAILCGGAEATVNPVAIAGFINCMALTQSDDPNAASLPFDRRRGGFVLGEGAAALILEDYAHAVARGAKIYAEVCGYGATCDAHHITAPDPGAVYSAKAIRDAVGEVSAAPENIYINAHGTGTALNDTTETTAIKSVFGEDAKKLHISSTKSMTGHLLGAAGAAEAVAAVLALKNGIVPPTIHLDEPDETCDLNYTPNQAVRAELTLALSDSLGFGGHNACIAFRKI